jgi:hypothetical protein
LNLLRVVTRSPTRASNSSPVMPHCRAGRLHGVTAAQAEQETAQDHIRGNPFIHDSPPLCLEHNSFSTPRRCCFLREANQNGWLRRHNKNCPRIDPISTEVRRAVRRDPCIVSSATARHRSFHSARAPACPV